MSKHKYIIRESIVASGDVLILTLVPQKQGRVIFKFKPGQYAMLSFKTSSGKLFLSHPFSIASSPTQINHLRFGIKILGSFTQNLSKLPIGSIVNVSGPFGKFVFNEKKYQNIIHITGGIGVTPFVSAARYASDKKLPNQMTMLYSSRTREGATFYNELRNLEKTNPNFKAIFSITKEEIPSNDPHLEKGYIDKNMILKHVGPLKGKTFMLCGPPGFMKVMEAHLKEMGVPKKLILQEAFSTTPNLPFKENFKNLFSVYGFTVIIAIFFLNFVYQKEQVKNNLLPSVLNPSVNIINNLNNITAQRMAGILELKNKTNLTTNKDTLNKQLDRQKVVFKQRVVNLQNPTIKKPPSSPYIPPVKIRPRTTVS